MEKLVSKWAFLSSRSAW